MIDDIEKYGSIDVSYYKDYFSINDDWDNRFSRDRIKKYKAHDESQFIPLQWSFKNLNEKPNVVAEKTEFYTKYFNKEFFDNLEKILQNRFGTGYPVRIVFTKLPRYSEIKRHRDLTPSFVANRRFHVPIKTNKDVIFGVHDKVIHMEEGGVYQINNFKEHFVKNNSNEDRIHLIVDWHRTQ